MSTLVTHHNGLDRIVRGVDVMVKGVLGGLADARIAASQRNSAGLASRPVASEGIKPSGLMARIAQWRIESARRRELLELEGLFRADPRLRMDFLAAQGRAESR